MEKIKKEDMHRADIVALVRKSGTHDYIRWANEVSGITRAWCYPLHQSHWKQSFASGKDKFFVQAQQF